MTRGTLILVVGPSGAGKDTLIDWARKRLAGDPRFVFARRAITRSADAGGEEHEAVSDAEFARRKAAGLFLLDWQAHGLAYGLPAALESELAAGRHVVANVSRAVIEDAARRLTPVAVVSVTAPREVLAARLAARGREQVAGIEERLGREGTALPAGVPVTTVINDGPVVDGIARFVQALEAIAGGPPK
jgi:phosphonate metabolism protein PhnN/1,5-bisphosphokinase (PRPP-forming)